MLKKLKKLNSPQKKIHFKERFIYMAKGTVVQKIIDAHYVAGTRIPGQVVAIKIQILE